MEAAIYRRDGVCTLRVGDAQAGIPLRPPGSRPTEIDRSFGMAWGVGGWVLPNFLARAEAEQVARMRSRVADGLSTTFATRFTAEVTWPVPWSSTPSASTGAPATGTKYLITP